MTSRHMPTLGAQIETPRKLPAVGALSQSVRGARRCRCGQAKYNAATRRHQQKPLIFCVRACRESIGVETGPPQKKPLFRVHLSPLVPGRSGIVSSEASGRRPQGTRVARWPAPWGKGDSFGRNS
jgi:hypothetical protein